MSLVTTGGIATSIVPSILPFDPTFGVTVVATVMLALFMSMMVFLAVAPVVSSSWSEQLGSAPVVESPPEPDDAEATSESEVAASDSGSEAAAASGATLDGVDDRTIAEGPFTRAELGKFVERADGKVIGTIASVGGDRARVEPAPDAIDRILIRFDRMDVGEAFVLDADSVDEISANRVHLEREFVRPTGGSTAGTEAEPSSATTE